MSLVFAIATSKLTSVDSICKGGMTAAISSLLAQTGISTYCIALQTKQSNA